MKINNREKKAAIKSQILMILLVALFAYPFLYMVSISFKSMPEIFEGSLSLYVKDVESLQAVMDKLRQIKGIESVKRTSN